MTGNSDQVAIFGCAQVKAAEVYSLLQGGAPERVLLVGDGCDRLRGEIMELQSAVPLARPVRIDTGSCEEAARAGIVVIAAAAAADQPMPETPLDMLAKNASVIREICEKLKLSGFDGIILVTTNPADILAQVALEASGLPPSRVIGSGIGWAEAGFQAAGGGESGLPETATWCAALNGSPPLVDFCQPNCPDFGLMLEALDRRTAPKEKTEKGCAYCPAGTCVNRICEAVLLDGRTVLPVFALADGQHGVSGVYLNLPCVIGRGGIEQIIELPLSSEEKTCLPGSAELLKKTFGRIKDKGGNSAAARIF